MSRFLTITGQIDEAAVLAAIDDCAAARRYRTGNDLPESERASVAEFFRLEASRERALFHGYTEEQWFAAHSFAMGALDGLTPPRTSYRVEEVEGPGIHTFERQQIAQRAIGRIIDQDRRDTFARCLAALDRSLARIRHGRGVARYLQAAE